MTTSSYTSDAERTLQLAERIVGPSSRAPRRLSFSVLAAYILLSLGAVVMVVPFIWMILTSLKPAPELVQFAFLPRNPTLDNYVAVLTTSSFGRWYFNSLLVAIISTTSVAFFDSLVGYTLNKFDFPGKNLIFLGILATLMVPTEMLIIPWFTMSVDWGWHVGIMQYWGIAFPGVITASASFSCASSSTAFDGLIDAAIDGVNEFGIWWRIAMPWSSRRWLRSASSTSSATGTPICGPSSSPAGGSTTPCPSA